MNDERFGLVPYCLACMSHRLYEIHKICEWRKRKQKWTFGSYKANVTGQSQHEEYREPNKWQKKKNCDNILNVGWKHGFCAIERIFHLPFFFLFSHAQFTNDLLSMPCNVNKFSSVFFLVISMVNFNCLLFMVWILFFLSNCKHFIFKFFNCDFPLKTVW